jgi:hypothetical protein
MWHPLCEKGGTNFADKRRRSVCIAVSNNGVFLMTVNTKKGVKIKTQNQSYEVLFYKERLM